MMILGLFANLLILGMVIFVINRILFRGHKQTSKEGGVRRFFQLGLLFALTVISGIGLSGLLGRLLNIGTSLTSDRNALALESSFTVVGIPLLLLVATWTRRTIAKDPSEKETPAWNFYLTAVSILALIVNLTAQLKIFKVIFADGVLQGDSISQFIVWGGIWFVHFRLLNNIRSSSNVLNDHLLGSLIGLGFSVSGLITILDALLTSLFRFNEGAVIISGENPLAGGLITFIVGAPVWYIYWIRTALRSNRESSWFAYVLLIGVGGGLLFAITAASYFLYSVLVWLLGEPATQSASLHFNDSPGTIAAALVGIIVIWYHRDVLSQENTNERTDIRRIYEYGIAGIGLIAAAGGITMILVSIIESLSKSTQIAGSGSTNSLLAAVTLIIVGGPIWWFVWQSIQEKTKANPIEEHSSLIRRVYLFILFGVAGIISAAMLLLGAYFIFKDLFQQGIGVATVRRMRFSLGILITAALVSVYHWIIFRGEKDVKIRKTSEILRENRVYFFVEIKIKPGKESELIHVINKYVVDVRKEKGCERFDVLIDPVNPSNVYLYEIWSNTQAHQAHLNTAEFATWKEFSDPIIEGFAAQTFESAEI
jgi:quinol monooxygenase YgiN